MMMRRRDFIARLGGAAVAWPLAARAQRTATPVIGLLSSRAPDRAGDVVAGIRRGLAEIGFVEGRNLAVEYRWAEDRLERLPALVNDLVRRQVAVIVTAGSTAAARAAQAGTKSIPIVFLIGSDPVEIGIVASLNRPGGNLTGLAILSIAVLAKRLELLHELVPTVTSIACLVDSTNPVAAEAQTRELQVAARTLGLRLVVVNASHQSDFETAFATIARERAGALVVGSDAVFHSYADRLVALASGQRMPVIFAWREVAEAGGLMSYGTDFPNAWRQLGVYAGRVLKGDKPADLPVEQVTKIELVLNTKTAKALGLTFPETLLATADKVIE
jgi:putative tryptophan/tyrosine transport system substrate-binding protein